ncbi:MAG: DUF386 domain-containing protein [Desulfuromonadales bacterium]|nr:DUF386 domain-containing protein [Desulfuromonadales bacterium]
MIVDNMEKWGTYFSGQAWNAVADFLATLNENSAEGEYPIIGDLIFARVMTYETKSWGEAAFEAHRNYIDIQVVLSGAEGIAWHSAKELDVIKPYHSETDVEFYVTPKTSPARVDVHPGIFVALFPHDAHMPQLKVDGTPERVKKVVVKVRKHIFVSPFLATD